VNLTRAVLHGQYFRTMLGINNLIYNSNDSLHDHLVAAGRWYPMVKLTTQHSVC
jgi:hypothetical protein